MDGLRRMDDLLKEPVKALEKARQLLESYEVVGGDGSSDS
jgi:hypothetical protein